MKTQKNKQKQKKPKKTQKKQQGIKERESEKKNKQVTLPPHPIFLNDFSHVVYLFLLQNLLSTIHLRY